MKYHFTIELESPKKHSIRYKATTEDAPVTHIYIKRKALPNPIPAFIDIDMESTLKEEDQNRAV